MTLATTPRDVCPACQAPTVTRTWSEMALMRHGGYGADRTFEMRLCPACGWDLMRTVQETRPDTAEGRE